MLVPPPPPLCLGTLRSLLSVTACAHHATTATQVSEYWLLAEALWPPLKTAITLSVGIVLALKLLTHACLWCLRRGGAKKRDGDGGDGGGGKDDVDASGRGGEGREKAE